MTISLPDTLTMGNSEKYKVSIRLWSGGLSFSGYVPSVGNTFFYREAEFDLTKPYVSSLKDFFFAHDFLTWMYKRVRVIAVSPQYTLVPDTFFTEEKKEQFLSYHFSVPEKRVLVDSLKEDNAKVVYGLDEEVYEFCSRSLVNPDFFQHITPQLIFWKKQSQGALPGQMYVVLHQKMMDVACYAQGHLLFANTFDVEQPEDMLYYILYVWRQVGMDQQKDQLRLFGEASLRNRIIHTLRTYLQHISPVDIPSDTYLIGEDIVQAPMDLISLSVCEL